MQAPPILDHAATLADLTRCRILRVLGRQELTVGELCSVVQLPQSTVSRHLKLLTDGGWLKARRQGTSQLYRFADRELDEPVRRLWRLVGEQLAATAGDAHDADRLAGVLAERRTRSQTFFTSTAGRWDQLRAELFGERFDLLSLLGLLDPTWTVGDLACGTGQVAAALAPFVATVEAVDGSQAMLAAARQRLDGQRNVAIREGDLEQLPLADDCLDAATLILALCYVPEPVAALREARRVLRPGGRLLIVDLAPHEREDLRQEMGHVWLGFAADDLERHALEAGFAACRYRALPVDPAAKGPSLFTAVATAPIEPAVDQPTRGTRRPMAAVAS